MSLDICASAPPYSAESICAPYPFSNDYWSVENVNELHDLVRQQSTAPENSAGLVIGAGGLPYIGAHILLPVIVVADLYPRVIELAKWGVAEMQAHTNWKNYDEAISHALTTEEDGFFGDEQATRKHLLGDFELTRQRMAETQIIGARGDLCHNAPFIGAALRRRELKLTYIGLTNAAKYAADSPRYSVAAGRNKLGRALSELPLAADAIIVDMATPDRTFYTINDYPGARAQS